MDAKLPILSDTSKVLGDLERGKVDAAAGRSTAIEPVLQRMLDIADELDASRARSESAVLKA